MGGAEGWKMNPRNDRANIIGENTFLRSTTVRRGVVVACEPLI